MNILRQSASEDFEFAPGGNVGIIVVSTRFLSDACTAESKGSSSAMISISEENEGARAIDHLWMKSPMLSNTDPADPTRQLLIRKMRAGKYYLNRFSFAWGYLPGQGSDSVKRLDMPFTVSAGQAYYLGEITITMTDCTNFTVKVGNQRQKDMALFATKIKKIPPQAVKDQLLLKGM